MKNLKLAITIIILSICTTSAEAQIGIGTTSPDGMLDITSTTDGLLIPRVSLTITTSAAPLILPTISELVYNTSSFNDVTPGFYYWNGTWNRLATGITNNSWNITGNSGIVDGTNYLGTAAGTNVDVAFRRNNLAAGKIGTTSTSFGVGALPNGASSNSTAIGNNALSVSTGNNNVAVGQNALRLSNTTAQFNTAVGVNALQNMNSNAGQYNTALGFNAMANGTGTFNNCVAVGANALLNNTNIGLNNTAIGFSAGSTITNGYNNLAIGANAQVPVANGINQVRIGDAAVSYAGIQVAWTITSDKRWKSNITDSPLGLNFIKGLRPVSYTRNNDNKKKTEYGFIAQELEKTLDEFNDSNNGIVSKDDADMYAVRYNDFIPISIKAIQEQQVLIEELKKENTDLKKANQSILNRLEALEKQQ